MRSVLSPALLALALLTPAFAETRVPQTAAEIGLSFAPVVKQAAPAVVNIYASRVVAERRSPFADDPFFGPLFRDFGPAQPRMQNSLGSGVILSSDGLVVSNYHVVGEAQEIRVVLADRREFSADILLADEESDLAVLRLRGGADVPYLEMRDSDGVEVGELVLAIGNPFGVGQTVTSGIVSGLARSGTANGTGRGWFIQTDAAINPGNSGGALVDINGRLVGINTSILTRSGGSNGIGFAIPSNLVARFVEAARTGDASFARPWAGVAGQPVTAEIAEGLGLGAPDGVLLSAVHPAGPFAAAGFRVGDVILSVGGHPVNTPQDVIFRLTVAGPGAEIEAERLRDGERSRHTLRLLPPPDEPPANPVTLGPDTALPGLTVATINPRLIAALGLPLDAEGVIVTRLEGYAARAGLQAGDILLAVNGFALRESADVERVAQQRVRNWAFDILRQGRRVQLRVRL